jgi:hypothetical protein
MENEMFLYIFWSIYAKYKTECPIMVSISLSKTVQYLIDNDPPIQDSLERNYANFSAIARLLKPKAEDILGKKVTLDGVITSVKRAKKNYVPNPHNQEIIAESVINLRTDVAKISLEKTRKNLENARMIFSKFPETYFQVLEGASTLTLITDQRIFLEVSLIFYKKEILEKKQNLAAITLQSPKGIVETPGCIVEFYNSISRGYINIEETISCFTETIIILSMEDATRAFSLLTERIKRARKEVKDKKL